MKKIFVFLFTFSMAFLGAGCELSPHTDQDPSLGTVTVGTSVLHVEIADTPALQQRGLMYRDHMPEDHGMLFVFDQVGPHGFWMKNTLLPLDIVWIDDRGVVTDIHTLLPCQADPCPTTVGQGDARYVLEVNSGAFPGAIGDQLEIQIP